MPNILRSILLFIAIAICPVVFGAVGLSPKTGTPSCGAIQDGQDLCGTGPASFESNAIGTCPTGSFADVGRWGCYTCPRGFDRGVADIDSDRACTKDNTNSSKPRFQEAQLLGGACPDGSFYDPIRGGECWTCPAGKGYIRSAAHIDWKDACVVMAEEVLKKATEHSNATGFFQTDCPRGQFWDPIDGKCHSCPSGYARTGYSVHSSKACSKVNRAQQSGATLVGQANCQDGEFKDFLLNPEQGGSCYTCPAGYDRTLFFRADSDKACETTVNVDFSIATKTTDLTCPADQIFDPISTNHADVIRKLRADGVDSSTYTNDNWGTCWSCPPGAIRSWSSVTASDACILADIGWNMPTYHHVGLFGLRNATEVVLDIINENDDIVALAQGYAAASTELSKDDFVEEVLGEISKNPEQSSILALAVYARLQTYASVDKKSLKIYERHFLDDFQSQVTDYRIKMAKEALNILDVWQDGAALRYIDPRFNTRPAVVMQKIFWLSIGVVAPPVSPPDFSALIYELEDTPTIDPVVLGMTAAERSIDHGILKTLMPADPVGDIGGKISDKIKDKLLSKAQEQIIKQIEKQMAKKAMNAGGKVTAKMVLLGPSSAGPQIAVALFMEYATQWADFIAGSADAKPKLEANVAQASQTYDVSRKLATAEGGLDLRHHYKTIMNSSVRPSGSDMGKIKIAASDAMARNRSN